MGDLSNVSTEDLLAQHYGGMDKVPTGVLMQHYQGAKPPASDPILDNPNTSLGDKHIYRALDAVGRGGKRFNDIVQKLIPLAVEKTGQYLGEGAGNAAAGILTPISTASEFLTPKDRWGAAAMLMPFGGNAVNSEALSVPMGKAARGLGSLAEGTVEEASKLYSKTTPQAFEMLRQNPEGTLTEARKGMTLNALTNNPEPVALQEAQAAGRNAQGIIDESSKGAGREYGQMMEHLKGDLSNDKFSVAEKVYDKMEPFVNNQTSYRSATRTPGIASDADIFNGFYDRIKATQAEGMTPGEAGDLLQQMTREQKAAKGMPLSAHIAELKNALLDALPGDYKFPTVDTATPGGWGIKETRDAYKAAKDLQRETAPFTNPQNPISALRSVARAGGDASVSLKNATEKIPALKAAIDKMNVSSAGAEFAPKFKTPPGTGLTGALGLLVTKLLGGNAAAIPATAVSALGMSPRYTAEALVAGRKVGAATMESARGAESKIPALLSTILRRKKGDLP